jgi:hypothetical protein
MTRMGPYPLLYVLCRRSDLGRTGPGAKIARRGDPRRGFGVMGELEGLELLVVGLFLLVLGLVLLFLLRCLLG